MKKEVLEIKKEGLFLGGEPFYIASGDMHYFRYFKEGWARRLQLMKDFGLNCVQTYVPWNLHEPEKGTFCFADNLDLAAFIRTCGDMGLKVLLRPSPYICSEWDFGGLPYWLLKDREVMVRTSEPKYIKHVEEYTKRLLQEFLPLLSTNGGPVIAVAVENEYGSFGYDLEYIRILAKMLKDGGVDVPLYTANGDTLKHIQWGSLPELWTAVDVHTATNESARILKEFQGELPMLVGEQWGGCGQQWGGVFNRMPAEVVAKRYKTSLENGFMVNFYMFCGATNFGFNSGAIRSVFRADVPDAKSRYIPYCTSYDVDAPVNEAGQPTEKYYALKKVLAEYLGEPYEENEFHHPIQNIGKVALSKTADFFENVENICTSKVYASNVKCMEDLNQDYGFTLYTTYIPVWNDRLWQLCIEGLGDRATVYGNGEYLGTVMRDREDTVRFRIPKTGMRLSILVENMGRVCFGSHMTYDRKGIEKCVRLIPVNEETGKTNYEPSLLTCWTMHTLPLKDITALNYSSMPKEKLPGFYKGEFEAESGVDAYIRLPGWNKGVVWVNGFNLGRYWKIGPQETLYVPGELLKVKNIVEVFELHAPNTDLTVEFCDKPSLDSIKQNAEKLVQADRV